MGKMEQMVKLMLSKMDAWIEDIRAWQKEIKPGQERTEACLECKKPTF
jgi:hypothetical protein